jgi:signal transduction histidine kinase
LEDVNRLRRVVDDFMNFSKIDTLNYEPLNLKKVIEEMRQRYLMRLPQDVTIETDIPANISLLQADGTQISMLLSNLIDNAVESIEPPGSIQIRAANIEKIQHNGGSLVKPMVEIEISDSGCGMNRETLDKIYQPFFTNKAGGSGLGMNIIQKIVEDHFGHIEVFSREREAGWWCNCRYPYPNRKIRAVKLFKNKRLNKLRCRHIYLLKCRSSNFSRGNL